MPKPDSMLSPSWNIPSTNSVSQSLLVEGVMLIEEMSRPLRLTSVTDTDTSFSPQPASSAVIIHRHSSMAAPRFHRFIGLPPGIDFSPLYMVLRQK